MKLKSIFAVGVMALLASCDESRFRDIKPQRSEEHTSELQSR